jgi:hypothetical protein
MYKNSHIRDLSDKLGRGEISPTQCLNILSTLMFERLALKETCEGMLTVEYNKESERRMEMYKSNPEWYNLRLKLIDCWRESCSIGGENIQTQISYLKDSDLELIDKDKLVVLELKNKDIASIYKSLEDLILIKK